MARVKIKRRRGIVAIEFALVVIPLLILIFGLIDYGWVFVKAQQITQAARTGARAAALADATNASVENAINTWMAVAGIETFTWDPTPDDIAGIPTGDPIKIEIFVPSSQFVLINTSIVPLPTQIHAAASMAKEGP